MKNTYIAIRNVHTIKNRFLLINRAKTKIIPFIIISLIYEYQFLWERINFILSASFRPIKYLARPYYKNCNKSM